MKIRTGFVSNSSSSSFVVAFDRKPETVEELQEMLFGDEKFYPNPYVFNERDPKGWPAEQVAKTVWGDMREGPANEAQVREVFDGGYIDGEPRYDYSSIEREKDMTLEERHKHWEERSRPRDEFHRQKADEFLKEHEGKVFYTFSYSDNDGSYFSSLEHGGLFDRLAHFTISNH